MKYSIFKAWCGKIAKKAETNIVNIYCNEDHGVFVCYWADGNSATARPDTNTITIRSGRAERTDYGKTKWNHVYKFHLSKKGELEAIE